MTATGKKAYRTPALDFTKEAWVSIMVQQHWINYFWGPQDIRYLIFLIPGLIFISGFIISNWKSRPWLA
jgi:hypothetical protein